MEIFFPSYVVLHSSTSLAVKSTFFLFLLSPGYGRTLFFFRKPLNSYSSSA